MDTQPTTPDPDAPQPDSIDDVLWTFVYLANEGGIGFGVTLSVGGNLIVGDIAPGRIWFEKLAERMSDDGEDAPAVREAIAKQLRERAATYRDLTQELRDDDSSGDDQRPIRFIHLENAELISSAPPRAPWACGAASLKPWTVGRSAAQADLAAE